MNHAAFYFIVKKKKRDFKPQIGGERISDLANIHKRYEIYCFFLFFQNWHSAPVVVYCLEIQNSKWRFLEPASRILKILE